MTTDPNDPKLRQIHADGPLKGQQKDYLVLSPEEREKGFVRSVMSSYIHLACGVVTTMGRAIAETYARDPKFYGGTFCCGCRNHFPLKMPDGSPAFLWDRDETPVGSSPEEAAAWIEERQRIENDKQKGSGI